MIDRFGRSITYLRLSVTELCNLRCRYCMPEDGVCKKDHSSMLTQEEKDWLNNYHERVLRETAPFLNNEEQEYLKTILMRYILHGISTI